MAKAYGVLNPGGVPESNPPTIPQNVLITDINRTGATVDWDDSTDDTGIGSYQVFANSIPVNLGVIGTQLIIDTLAPSTLYIIEVSASDVYGNTSGLSDPVQFTTTANNPPTWSWSDQFLTQGAGFSLDLDTVTDDIDPDTLTYTVESGALPTGLTLLGNSVTGTPSANGVFNATLRADDGFDTTDQATVWTVSSTDTISPAAPSGLTIGTVTSSTINLDWDDNIESDFNTYTVYRSTDGVNFGVRQAGLLVSNFTDSGLSASTQYWYKVTATDTSGNESIELIDRIGTAGATQSASAIGTTGLVVAIPTEHQEGDLLVCTTSRSSNNTDFAITGWTDTGGQQNPGASPVMEVGILYKIAGASEPSTVTLTNSDTSGAAWTAQIHAFRNVHSTPEDAAQVISSTVDNANAFLSNSITTVTDQAVVLGVVASNGSSITDYDPPPGYALISNQQGSDRNLMTAWAEKTPAGAEVPGTVTGNGGAGTDDHAGLVWAFKPSFATVTATTDAAGAGLGPFPVFPLASPSIFDFWDGVTLSSDGTTPLPQITNNNATWQVTAEDPLDGDWIFWEGGAVHYTRGALTGIASFTYQVLDYDGLGTNFTDIATLTVL